MTIDQLQLVNDELKIQAINSYKIGAKIFISNEDGEPLNSKFFLW